MDILRIKKSNKKYFWKKRIRESKYTHVHKTLGEKLLGSKLLRQSQNITKYMACYLQKKSISLKWRDLAPTTLTKW